MDREHLEKLNLFQQHSGGCNELMFRAIATLQIWMHNLYIIFTVRLSNSENFIITIVEIYGDIHDNEYYPDNEFVEYINL